MYVAAECLWSAGAVVLLTYILLCVDLDKRTMQDDVCSC